ncbi:MAG: ATP-binding protein [Pseudomonadota bacterium]
MQSVPPLLKRYLPKSLFGRALLILVLPMLLLQVVVALVFIQRHYDGVTAQMAGSIAREINYAIARVDSAAETAEAQEMLEELSAPLGLELGLDEGGLVEPAALRTIFDLTGGVIAETLKDEVVQPFALDLVTFEKHVEVRVATSKGALRILIPRRRLNAANPHLLLVWMGVSALLLTAIATVFLRNQVRPIHELAVAASAFGRGRAIPFRPSGADEVRRAGGAFLDMRNRIERHVEQRTRMLSGVSHDLKTPLTRMKLALAVSDDNPEVREISRDVDEMEQMLSGFLAFARGEEGEVSELVSPVELVQDVASDARRNGAEITVFSEVMTPETPMIEIRRTALRRAMMNLVTNAVIYGGMAAISVRLTERFAEFSVEDDGPGIPEDKRDDMLKPFTRLDEARNQDLASGTGLGLSIALDITRSHGGSLKLDQSPRMGGLRATILIPR